MHYPNQNLRSPTGEELSVINGTEAPNSPEAEVRLMSGVLLDETGHAWALAQNCGVKPKAFYQPGAMVLWALIGELRGRGEAVVDLSMLAAELNLRGQLEEIGGMEELMRLTTGAGSSMNTRYYAELLVLLWHLRHSIVLSAQLREAALGFQTREDFIAKAGTIGQKLIRLGRREATQTLADIYNSVEEEARARANGTVDKSLWVSSGIKKFDDVCKRFGSAREDGFVVIAGGSGHGKSVALRQIGGAALEEKKTVLAYSRETSTAGFIEMLVASKMGFDLNKIEWQPKPDMERFYAECRRQRDEWADRLLYCVQNEPATPLLTVEDLCEHARAFVHLHGVPHVVLVDYLQIFGTRKRMPSREAEVGFVSHALQALQRELGCVVVVVVQLNESGLNEMRQLKRDENGKVIHRLPKPGDLRESQAIYHDADRMIFLYKPPVDCCDRDQTSPATPMPEVWWFQEKRRRGGIEIVRCWFEKRFTRFVALGVEDLATANRSAAQATGTLPKGTRISKDDYIKGATP